MLSKVFITAFASIAAVQALPNPGPSSDIVLETLDAIPDGAWLTENYPNGTTVAHSVNANIKRSVVVHARANAATVETKRSVEKRFVSCWGTQLDHYGTDGAARCLRDAAAAGRIDVRTGENSIAYTCIVAAVQVYYCVDKPNSWGNANLEDINYGLSQMDSRCPAYTASYFRWDNTPEIVGKARADTQICITQT